MKKLILSLLKSQIGKAIIRILIDEFLRSLAKKGYYMTASSADARDSVGRNSGNILNSEMFRKAMVSEYVETELDELNP
jgi:hypothetical protein